MPPATGPILALQPKRKSKAEDAEVLSGLIERVVFHNPENGFCVLKVKARGSRNLEAVVGRLPAVKAGEWITASGRWVNDRSHGLQFEAAFIKTSKPNSRAGIEKYMGSGLISGIGKVYAKNLVDAFGDQLFDVIEHEPERLREVTGIGPVRARKILAAWDGQKVVREIMVFLHGHGIGTGQATRIYNQYGVNAVQVLSENPYCLARDIRGIGFAAADGIAKKLGIDPEAPVRIQAGVRFVLREATSDGHCGLPREDLLKRAQRLLQVRADLAASAIEHEAQAGEVVEDTVDGKPCVFLASLFRAEQGIAKCLAVLLKGGPPWPPIDTAKAVPWIQSRIGITLAKSQAQAVSLALESKVTVITGGPGVGKTTIVNAILRILAVKDVEIALCAPTGRAAKRLSETSGCEAKTIHRLLEFDPARGKFRRGPGNRLECGFLVVDETSMVDVPLMHSLLKALPREAALLLVGDVDQLPSVGPGRVLGDLIESGAIPVARLVEVFRQAARSRIVVSAHRINQGQMPDLGKPATQSDFYFVPAQAPEVALQRTIRLVRDRIPGRFGLDPIRDIQVLCPMNRGGIGAKSLNLELQSVLNPNGSGIVERFGWKYALGDKVMQVENDYDKEIYNGDIGFIRSVDAENSDLKVEFDGREVDYGFKELDTLVPAYATTIHKSQGSEYPAVVVLIMNQHFVMLQRNLIYTAITRGKQLVVLVGQRNAVYRAVQTASRSQRCSKLREWVQGLDRGPVVRSPVLPGIG